MSISIKDIDKLDDFNEDIGRLLPLFRIKIAKISDFLNDKKLSIQKIKNELNHRLDDANIKLQNRNNEYTLSRAKHTDDSCFRELWKVQLAKSEQRAARKNMNEILTIETFVNQEIQKYKGSEIEFKNLLLEKGVRSVDVLSQLSSLISVYMNDEDIPGSV